MDQAWVSIYLRLGYITSNYKTILNCGEWRVHITIRVNVVLFAPHAFQTWVLICVKVGISRALKMAIIYYVCYHVKRLAPSFSCLWVDNKIILFARQWWFHGRLIVKSFPLRLSLRFLWRTSPMRKDDFAVKHMYRMLPEMGKRSSFNGLKTNNARNRGQKLYRTKNLQNSI